MASNALSVLIYMHILFCRHAIISDPVFFDVYMYVLICTYSVYIWCIWCMVCHEYKKHYDTSNVFSWRKTTLFFYRESSDNVNVFYKWSQEALTCKAFILAFRPAHVSKFQLKSIFFIALGLNPLFSRCS